MEQTPQNNNKKKRKEEEGESLFLLIYQILPLLFLSQCVSLSFALCSVSFSLKEEEEEEARACVRRFFFQGRAQSGREKGQACDFKINIYYSFVERERETKRDEFFIVRRGHDARRRRTRRTE